MNIIISSLLRRSSS